MKVVAYLIAFLTTCSLFFACNNDDNFSTDGSMRLNFSSDTIRFDTVFTTVGTATKRLKVYNRNKDALTISNIELLNADKTGFRMNVDGESGSKISNIDVLGKDSLYVFVEVTVDPLNQNTPMFISDSIRFQFNGVTQYIALEAIGQDVILWRAKTIEQDTLITAEKPILVYDSIYVKSNATLNIQKNVQLYFHKGAGITVAGRIHAVGTTDEPIVLRGDRTDLFIEASNLPYDRVPGQWNGITVLPGSYNNVFENVRIRNGIYGVVFQQSDTTELKASFLNTVIQNTSKEGILSINCKIEARNCLFANSGMYNVRLLGGTYSFLHCTIANYLRSTLFNLYSKEALVIEESGLDAQEKEVKAAMGTCSFINTIIAGNSAAIINMPKDENITFEYRFINCLLKIPEKNNTNYVNTVWNADPEFKYIYSLGMDILWFYNFELTEISPARNKASRKYAATLPVDIRGVSRTSDDAPDIGCFEWK